MKCLHLSLNPIEQFFHSRTDILRVYQAITIGDLAFVVECNALHPALKYYGLSD